MCKKLLNENKSVNLCTLPSCKSVIRLNSQCVNFVAGVWKKVQYQKQIFPHFVIMAAVQTRWVESIFPGEIEDIVEDDDYHKLDIIDEEGESGSKD